MNLIFVYLLLILLLLLRDLFNLSDLYYINNFSVLILIDYDKNKLITTNLLSINLLFFGFNIDRLS